MPNWLIKNFKYSFKQVVQSKLTLLVFLISFLLNIFPSFFYPSSIELPYDDEPGYIGYGRIQFETLFIEWDLFSGIWQENFKGYGTPNPRLPAYIIGFFKYLADKINSSFFTTRMLMLSLAAGCSTLLYILVRLTVSNIAGIIAAELLLLNPIFQSIRDRMVYHIPLLFFTLLTLISLVKIKRNFKKAHNKKIYSRGILLGITISCHLYAIALWPVLLSALLVGIGRKFKESISIFFYVSLIAFSVFIITNPLLYSDLVGGIKCMTTGHVTMVKAGVAGCTKPDPDFSFIKYIITFPFILFRNPPFMMAGVKNQWPPSPSDYFFIGIGYLLFIRGMIKIISNRGNKRNIPLAFFFSIFSLISYIIISLPNDWWTMPKTFILNVASLIWIFSFNFMPLSSKITGKQIENSYQS
ncbi:phospholipid carrier-dependent glycosyltransferase [Candidatus Auribacterota bacterium]